METIKETKVKCLPHYESIAENNYEYRIAIASDLLYVLNAEGELLEVIIEGKSKQAYVGIVESQDDLLDLILICLDYHKQGINLLTLVDVSNFS